MPHEPLAVVAGLALALAPVAAGAQESAGATVFVQIFGVCHQADGSGTPGYAPALTGAHWRRLLAQRTYLPRVIAFGLTGQIQVDGAVFNSGMAAQAQLSDEQLADVANFVASSVNAAHLPPGWKPYDAAEVAALRSTPHGSVEQRQLRKQALAP
jgi:mono/diheme cytochrome c family protein